MNDLQSRVTAGHGRASGQFAESSHSEPDATLGDQDDATADGPSDGRCPDCGQYTSPDGGHVCHRRTVLASRMDELQHKVALANRKLRRNGIPGEFVVEILDRRTETRTEEGGATVSREMVDYRIEQPPLKLGDWEFAGRLDILPDGTPVAMTKEGIELDGYRPDTQRCDHCHTNRARKATYLLQGPDGEVKQVGSNCLEAFTGVAPRGLWALEWEPELAEPDDEAGGFGGGGWERTATPMEVLRMALAVTDNGKSYVSQTRAEWGREEPTAGTVRTFLWPDRRTAEQQEYRDAMAQAGADETEAAAAEVLDYARTMEGDGDYPTNMRALAAQEQIGTRHVGILASAVAGWHRDREQAAREAAEAANPGRNEWVGKVGDKLTDVKATVTGVRYIDGNYGTTTLITFLDSDGHTLKWFASGHKDVDEGNEVTLARATIKGHDEWKGTKQTVMTRAKLVPVDRGES